MKVMWHMPVLRADACGLSIRAVALARALVERGDQVLFLVAADKTDLVGDSVDGIPVQRVAVNRRRPRHWSLQAVARRSTAREIVGRIGFDADLLISCQPETVSAWADAAKAVPVLFVCAGTTLLHDAADGERQARHGPVDRMAFEVDRRLKHRNEREAFERADSVVLDSSSTLSLVTHHYGLNVARFHAVLGGVDPSRFAPPDASTRQSHRRQLGLKQDERVAVFCSRLARNKVSPGRIH